MTILPPYAQLLRLRIEDAGGRRVLAMPFHDANLSALKELHHSDFAGRVAAVAQYEDQVSELEKLGVDTVINLYSGAGLALAVEAQEDLEYPDN